MACSVPQDGQGLANLYGGRAALAEKLDQLFETTLETDTAGANPRIDIERRYVCARRFDSPVSMDTAISRPIIFHICISMPVGLTVRRRKFGRYCGSAMLAAASARDTSVMMITVKCLHGLSSVPWASIR